MSAQLRWLIPMLRWSVGLVWIATGVISLGFYPVSESYALLARVGLPAALAPVALSASAALDLFLGFLSFSRRPRAWVWLVQTGVILVYTAIISFKLPEFWLHPFGPLLKNIPMLAAIWLIYELEPRAWNI